VVRAKGLWRSEIAPSGFESLRISMQNTLSNAGEDYQEGGHVMEKRYMKSSRKELTRQRR